MSTKLTTRRSHLNKFVKNLTTQAIDSAMLTSRPVQDQRRLLKLRPHAYLLMAEHRQGTYEGWNILALRCNVGNYIANRYFVKEMHGPHLYITAALRALTTVHARFVSMDRIGLTQQEAEVISLALWVVDELQDATTPQQWTEATKYIFELAGVTT